MHSPSNWKYYNFLISLFSFFQSIKYLKNKTLLEKRSNHTLKCIPKWCYHIRKIKKSNIQLKVTHRNLAPILLTCKTRCVNILILFFGKCVMFDFGDYLSNNKVLYHSPNFPFFRFFLSFLLSFFSFPFLSLVLYLFISVSLFFCSLSVWKCFTASMI